MMPRKDAVFATLCALFMAWVVVAGSAKTRKTNELETACMLGCHPDGNHFTRVNDRCLCLPPDGPPRKYLPSENIGW